MNNGHHYAEIIEDDAGVFDRKLSALLDQIAAQGGFVVKIDMQMHQARIEMNTGHLNVPRIAQILYIGPPHMQLDKP